MYDRLTSAGQRPGTPLYMSPEQVLNTKPVDQRTDIFSMGVCLYEALAQREPFRGQNIQETFENIINDTPAKPSEVAKQFEIPPVLDEACMKALQKEPSDRYSTILELGEVLRIAAEQMPD